MIRSLLLAGLLLSVTGAGAAFSDVQLSFMNVEKQNNDIVLTWQTVREDAVDRYEVQRRSRFSNNQWVKVAQIQAHGTGKPYQIRDDQVYKADSEQVDYQVEAVFSDGVRKSFEPKSINYTPTAVRRTWGSIKAMFQ